MAIKTIQTQGTTISIGGQYIGCIQSIGTITESRNITEYTCIDSNDNTKAMGAISRGNLSIQVLFDPGDTEGQQALRDAFYNNVSFETIIEFSDMPASGTNGTKWTFTGQVSQLETAIEKDAAVLQTFTLEVLSDIVETPAA